MKICVMGLGYIGLPTAALMAKNGHEVVGAGKLKAQLKPAEAFALKDLLAQNGSVVRKNGYSIDRFNYRQGPRTVAAVQPKVSVIVAVYNNGWFLYGRAFASLQRSSLFDQMEVILVDDGSTDGFTRRMIRHLEFLYPGKVRSYFFEGGGSGSASRPRNKGVELARGEYIMILDPDNEYICDALPTLLAEAEKAHADFAFGNTFVRKADSSTVLNYYKGKYKDDRSTVIRDCNKLQRDTALATVNIQVAMTRRSFMLDNHLEEVVGGAGEDTFVYQQMLDKAKVIVRVPILVEIYYADREGSVVNDLTERFFNKYYLTETEKCKWFAQAGLMDVYVAKRFGSYIKSWHFDALSHVAESQREICTKRLYDIIRLYEPYYRGGDTKLDAFIAACKKGSWMEAYSAAVAK